MRIALKIDVPTYRAALLGVPALADILRRHRAGASFAVSLGPDRSGRALNHFGRHALLGCAEHATLAEHLGARSLLHGSLLPAPETGKRCAELLRRVRDEGFEIGIHGWTAIDCVLRAEQADAAWHDAQFGRAIAAYRGLFATPPIFCAAPGWRANPHGLRLTQRLGFAYASDTRGRHPFVPVWNGEIVRCPQIPTTLPTLDELADGPRADTQALVGKLLALTAGMTENQVFTLRAGAEIAARPEPLEELLTGWREQGHEVVSVQALAAGLDVDKLPRHEIIVGKVPGRHGTLLLQGEEFLSAWRQPA